MAYEQERASILQIVNAHSSVPVRPEFSTPAARLIIRRCATLKRKPPMVIQRFMDRVEDRPQGSAGGRDKTARDFFRKDYQDLPEERKGQVQDLHSAMFNPATPHPYFKAGLTFAEGHSLLVETYREESKRDLPKELQAAMIDFRNGLEKDLDESAKAHGFYQEYSRANQALRIAAVGPHRINQSTPIVTARR
jgi:hypothetical protein